MIKIEQKIIANKPFLYLSEQINIDKKFKKIQVYIGKTIPNDLTPIFSKLAEKELELTIPNLNKIYQIDKKIDLDMYKEIEKNRVKFKYSFTTLSQKKLGLFWREFAIQFIFESNSIEGSRLSQSEVENIINNKYIKKNLDKKEVLEVENSIKAFETIRSNNFKPNQNSIKSLHKILVSGLGIDPGYKKEEIIVNNKKTTLPKNVKKEMTDLLSWWKKEMKTKKNKFFLAIKFHQRFELIHPFSDGNGRVGRLILIWMLRKINYGLILFKSKNRKKYFSALSSADEGRNNKLYRYCVGVYKETVKSLL